jgi:4-amino-4-deoxy-L-arabinose transferase-like glycosyltransferase
LDVRILLQLFLILAAGLLIYCLHLGNSPLDRTEPFRALVAHQMVHGGSWLVPRLYGELYLRKPPLIYWIEAATELLFHHGNEFVWRLPSAVGSALLAVFVAWWSGRWFGKNAILPAGFACLALIAVWDQDRSADIDALNTAFAVVTSAIVLEILYGNTRRTGIWGLVFGVSLGATLLLKGPGGLPQIFAAMIGPPLLMRDWKPVQKRIVPLVAGLLVGFAAFAAYVIAAKVELRKLNIPPDPTGWYEVVEKIFLHGWKSRLTALLTPFALLIFALPASLALPFSVLIIRKMAADDVRRTRAMALLGTLGVAALIWVVEGNDNPRYEYVMLPLLAPLVGFAWTNWSRREVGFHQIELGLCALFSAVSLVIAFKLSRVQSDGILIGVATISILITGALAAAFASRQTLAAKAAGPVVVVLLLLFAFPMAARKNAERQRKSAKNPAAQLRSIIGNSPRVSAAGVVRDLPELFYYAGVDVDSYGEFGLPRLVQHRGHWVVISQGEKYPAYTTILKYIPKAFPRGIAKLNMPDPRDQIYVGWYDPPAGADTRIEWNVVKQVEPED